MNSRSIYDYLKKIECISEYLNENIDFWFKEEYFNIKGIIIIHHSTDKYKYNQFSTIPIIPLFYNQTNRPMQQHLFYFMIKYILDNNRDVITLIDNNANTSEVKFIFRSNSIIIVNRTTDDIELFNFLINS